MSDLISREAAIDSLTALSCDDNAHWGVIIDTIRDLPTAPAPDVAAAARVLLANMPPINDPAWFALMQAYEGGGVDSACIEAWLSQIAGGDGK